MESINLILQKYVWKVELSIKLLPYSPQSNEKKNWTLKEMINALLISFGLPQNLCGGTILTAKGNNKKFCLFIKKAMENFVFPGHNLFHMRNGNEGNPTWNISKCGGV